MSAACIAALRSIVSSARAARPPSSLPARSMRVQPRMALSGVRSSCETRGEELVLGAVGALDLLARLLLDVDVGGGGDPAAERAVGVELRQQMRQVPAELAVAGAAHAQLALERLPLAQRLGHVALERLALVGVHHAPAARARAGHVAAGVALPDGVAVVGLARRTHGEDDLRHGLDERGVARRRLPLEALALELAQRRLALLEQLAALPQLDEDRHLAAQDLGVVRLHHVVDGAVRVALEDVRRVLGDGGEEDDRDVARAVARLDERGGLEAVEPRHLHVHDDERELVAQDAP